MFNNDRIYVREELENCQMHISKSKQEDYK